MQLTGDVGAPLEASVVEARVDKGLGVTATAIIRDGQISVGDFLVAGSAWGRVRALLDHQNKKIERASPAMPIQVFLLVFILQIIDILFISSFSRRLLVSIKHQFREIRSCWQ